MNPAELPSTVAQLLVWAEEATATIQALAERVEELERSRVPAKDRILMFLRFFAPMRFTAADVAEELGMPVKSAGVYLGELAARTAIGRVDDPEYAGRFLYFAIADTLEDAA